MERPQSDFSNFSDYELEQIAQDLLNAEYGFSLEHTALSQGSTGGLPDLWQTKVSSKKGGSKPELEIIVEVKVPPKNLESSITSLTEYVKEFNPNRYFFVLFFELSDNEKEFLITDVGVQTGLRAEVFDLEWIELTLDNHNKIRDKWGIKYLSKSSQGPDRKAEFEQSSIPVEEGEEEADKDYKSLKTNPVSGKARTFWVGGYNWDGNNDQSERFLAQGIWENGHDNKDTKWVNLAKVGDVLLLKSTFVKQRRGTIRFKAIGYIHENPNDGHLLKVNWYEFKDLEIIGLGQYRRTFQRITDGYIDRVLNALVSHIPNLENVLDRLSRDVVLDQSEDSQDKIPFHYDRVVDEDKLGREPVAKAFVNLIKKDIFKKEMDHAFMVHLQGEWGAGKSTFLNLIKKNLNEGDEKWIVVNYNAWQNQHLSPPWWTLIDQIFRQSKADKNFNSPLKLSWKEKWRRVLWYSGSQKIGTLLLTLIFIALLVIYGDSLLGFLIDAPGDNVAIGNTTKGLTLEVFSKLILSIGSVIGLIYSLSKFISTPFFMESSGDATSFMSRAADPLTQIKKHFNELVDDINNKQEKRQLAIFIDDIDRCDRTFIIELLEGIQTLFKEKRILYIVAGDKQWISTSFEKTYGDFKIEQASEGSLGELFLEKAFQLSVRMPNISEKAKQEYWTHILGVNEVEGKLKQNIAELDNEQQNAIQEKIKSSKEDITSPEFMEELEKEYNLSQDSVSDLIIEEKNESSAEIRHLLKNLHEQINTNPRAIIRLANNYTMERSTLIAERKPFDAHKLFRWLVIRDLYPMVRKSVTDEDSWGNFVDQVEGKEKEKEKEKELSESLKERLRTLLVGNEDEDRLSYEDFVVFEGK